MLSILFNKRWMLLVVFYLLYTSINLIIKSLKKGNIRFQIFRFGTPTWFNKFWFSGFWFPQGLFDFKFFFKIIKFTIVIHSLKWVEFLLRTCKFFRWWSFTQTLLFMIRYFFIKISDWRNTRLLLPRKWSFYIRILGRC